MTSRKLTAAAILVAWIATVGWYAGRLYLRPEAERVARAARTLPPGVAYYGLHRGNRQVGWARSRVDTLPAGSGFLLTDLVELDASAPGFGGSLRLEARTRLGPALTLARFEVEARGLLGRIDARGTVAGDSLLEVVVAGPADTSRTRVELEGGIVPATAFPLRIAASALPEAGGRISFPSLDPFRLRPATVALDVGERSVRSYPDSAVRDPESGAWRPARRDTVLAWRVVRDVPGLPVEAWIDRDGRIVAARVGASLRVRRTAFELAYFGRPGAEGDRPPRSREPDETSGHGASGGGPVAGRAVSPGAAGADREAGAAGGGGG